MGRWSQRHRDTSTLEERRLRGYELLRHDVSQAEVAHRLGVTPQAVYYWSCRLSEGGVRALHAQPRSGRPSRLSGEQLRALPGLHARGAQSCGYDTELWTTDRVADVLAKEWGVHYTNVGVWKILKAHGFSWQRPRRQAREKDLRAMQNWKRRSWPRYKKKPDANGP